MSDEGTLQEPGEAADDDLVALRRVEVALVRADLEHRGVLERVALARLRYGLGLARIGNFQPGAAAAGGRTARAEVDLGVRIAGLRAELVERLSGPLRAERDPEKRLRGTAAVAEELGDRIAAVRTGLLDGGDVSAADLDAEAGRRVLVNVAGGGGGAGYVYIGAYERLERAGLVPGYVIGSSIGALLGLFRARAKAPDWNEYVALAKTLDRRELFSAGGVRRRHGLNGLLTLRLTDAVGDWFRHEDGTPLRIEDLEIPYEAVVGGVRRRSFDQLPRRFRDQGAADGPYEPASRRSPLRLAPAVATRMWQVAAFFDPRVVKPVVLGADDATRAFDAVNAAGFSAAIPGVLHYEVGQDDTRMHGLLDDLFEREDLAALIDGGVTANVPAEIAHRRIQTGVIGTRNAFVLAFDCFHPQWDPRHLWLQPITQGIQLQMARNAPFADWIIRFKRTLSPVNLVPSPGKLEEAIGWGQDSVEDVLPFVKGMLEPVEWEA